MRAACGASPTLVALFTIMAALAVPLPSHAQWRAEASLGAAAARVGASHTMGIDAAGDARGTDATSLDAAAAVVAARRASRWGTWRLELVGEAGHAGVARATGGEARAALRLGWSRDGQAGLAVDAGALRAWRSARDPDELPDPVDSSGAPESLGQGETRPMASGASGGLTGWVRLRGVLLTASARTATAGARTERFEETRWRTVDSLVTRSRFDSVANRWQQDTVGWQRVRSPYLATGDRAVRLQQTDVALGAAGSAGALGLALAGGVRHVVSRPSAEGWANARATLAIGAGMALSVQASRLATDVVRALPARAELQVGVVLRPWRGRALPVALPAGAAAGVQRLSARRDPDGRVTITMDARGARTVELMGDFTAWRPVALERAGAGAWRLTIAVPEGVHQVNVRVDGGPWMPPPGLGIGDDGFGGVVGLLVL